MVKANEPQRHRGTEEKILSSSKIGPLAHSTISPISRRCSLCLCAFVVESSGQASCLRLPYCPSSGIAGVGKVLKGALDFGSDCCTCRWRSGKVLIVS